MKISWGTKIAGLYIGFVVMIVCLVFAASSTKTELVADNYYEQEVGFQKRIDATKSTLELKNPVILAANSDQVMLNFPQDFQGQQLNGKIQFYSASNATADKSFDFTTHNLHWQIAKSQLPPAKYEIQISWTDGRKDYYQSLPLNLL